MDFHSLILAGSRGSCLKMKPLSRLFNFLPRDPTNVKALKQTFMIVVLAFYKIP